MAAESVRRSTLLGTLISLVEPTEPTSFDSSESRISTWPDATGATAALLLPAAGRSPGVEPAAPA
jgi:hypothetical protein